MSKVLILGGYGNFGERIATALAKAGIAIVIAGRSKLKANKLIDKLRREHPGEDIGAAIFDVNTDFAAHLKNIAPVLVINTCGPFQLCDYSIAENCIAQKVHYIDLADGREFVTGITSLDSRAKEMGVTVISGASTVPGLSSAVLENFKDKFSAIHSMQYGISPGQKATRGLATTKSIMSYVGKPLKSFAGNKKAYGWQNIYRQEYPLLGKRWMANCEIPDLDLFPERYGIKSIRFSAGMELSFMHLGIWLMSWLVRLGVPLNLIKRSSLLLRISNWFDALGSADGGMHVIINGKDKEGKPKELSWFIIAKNGDGPQIPTIPAIILARIIVSGASIEAGAKPCVGLVQLDDCLNELKEFDVEDFTNWA